MRSKVVMLFIGTCFILFSCSNESKEKENKKTEKQEELVVIKDGVFTEYYPGRKKIKFRGRQDDQAKRHGRWVFYGESGEELSVTHYEHGKREGHSIVKYPNGAIHYIGEYKNDEKIGLWRIYDENGKVTSETMLTPEN